VDLMAVPIVVIALLINRAFLRDPLASRLPDVIVPAVLLGAWLVGQSMRLSNRAVSVVAIAVLVVTAGAAWSSLAAVRGAREQLARTNVWLGPGEIPHLFHEKTVDLKARFARSQLPDGRLFALVPFFEYLDRCTTPRHYLLVAGNAPEVYVYAQRPFAAGQPWFIEGYFQSEREQQRQLERASRQVIPFALLLSDQFDDFRASFPRLHALIESRFRPLTEITLDEARTARVMVHTGVPPSRVDAETGWPCYR